MMVKKAHYSFYRESELLSFFCLVAYMLLEAIFEWGDKIGWIRAFLNIVDL